MGVAWCLWEGQSRVAKPATARRIIAKRKILFQAHEAGMAPSRLNNMTVAKSGRLFEAQRDSMYLFAKVTWRISALRRRTRKGLEQTRNWRPAARGRGYVPGRGRERWRMRQNPLERK
jgi:hypothetical protein